MRTQASSHEKACNGAMKGALREWLKPCVCNLDLGKTWPWLWRSGSLRGLCCCVSAFMTIPGWCLGAWVGVMLRLLIPLQVRVRGKRVFSLPQRKHYFALNKPKGYLCSNSPGSAEEGGAANLVTDLFSEWLRQVIFRT